MESLISQRLVSVRVNVVMPLRGESATPQYPAWEVCLPLQNELSESSCRYPKCHPHNRLHECQKNWTLELPDMRVGR